jgi:starch synthase
MDILHVSAECYPVAKAGGLGDVVGSLPRFQREKGHNAAVVMPMYKTPYLYSHQWELVHKSSTNLGHWTFDYSVIKEKSDTQGFPLYLLDINGLLDREKVYGYDDDTERFCAFQIAVVHWLNSWQQLPEIVHVHDHHAGLIPFMMQHCYAFKRLQEVKTILTIHNAQYQGCMDWNKSNFLPAWDKGQLGLLDWDNKINPLACGVKCASAVTTVSPSYMAELQYSANGLEKLFEYEKEKCVGILNGIDSVVWDTKTDTYILSNFTSKS